MIGDMDVIGASVIKPVESVGGYSFDPEMLDEMDGEDGLTKNSSVVKKNLFKKTLVFFLLFFKIHLGLLLFLMIKATMKEIT